MEVRLDEKDARDWKYRGEGAANLVLAYTGSSPSFMGKVIRVQKVEKNASTYENGHPGFSEHECILWRDAAAIVTSPTKEIAGQMFVQCVMIPLLGSEFVDAGTQVLVSREFLESVERNVLCERPAWRVSAAKINVYADSVLLMSDHSVFPVSTCEGEPCISVEIKPKCGFLPESNFIAEQNASKKSITRFEMHQVLKLQELQIPQLSEYDPLDLFSGSRERILKAIKGLFATPQNNLRAFLNGSLIYGGIGGGTHGTTFVKAEAFEDYLKSFIRADDGLRTTNFMHLLVEAIVKLGLFDRLLEVQKRDKYDIEGAIHAYYDVVSQPCMVCQNSGEDKQTGKYMPLHSIPLDESVNIVKDYLIAATAKDCSIMISFRPREDSDPDSQFRTVYLDSTKQRFDIKASFIDLDMKPLKKMKYYYELDQKIVTCYNQAVQSKREAVKAECLEGHEAIYGD